MKTVFRVDASSTMGSGHVMRCLTLASALRDRGAICHFICRAHDGNLIWRIEQDGFKVHTLQKGTGCKSQKETSKIKLQHEKWLGEHWQEDAELVQPILQKLKTDWLIIDHYALDQRWESMQRMVVNKIMVIDDLADRIHDCDILLDQNLVDQYAKRYDKLVPIDCIKLLGPDYLLMKKEYAKWHLSVPERSNPIQRIFIYFGAADRFNMTGLAIQACKLLGDEKLVLEVVISESHPFKLDLVAYYGKDEHVILRDGVNSLAESIMKADLAIGGGGATSWERCVLGLPSLIITIAENQKPIAEALDQGGYAEWLGHYNEISLGDITDSIKKFFVGKRLNNMSRKCFNIGDPSGILNVLKSMLLNKQSPLKARLAQRKDEEFLFACMEAALLVKTKTTSILDVLENAKIKYQREVRNIDNYRYYVVENQVSQPIGFVRFVRVKDKWRFEEFYTQTVNSQQIEFKILQIVVNQFFQDMRELGNKDSSQFSVTLFTNLGHDSSAGMRLRNNSLIIGVCSDCDSWINDHIPLLLCKLLRLGHKISWVNSAKDLPNGDICFYLSYGSIVDRVVRSKYRHNLVVHESDLPKGKGWSPISWQILAGKEVIVVSLIEAHDKVDSGPIYMQKKIHIMRHELVDQIRHKQAETTFSLCLEFVQSYPKSCLIPEQQKGKGSYYRRRAPMDSEIDPGQSIAEQFDLLRIVDNQRYPAFFEMHGVQYVIKINRVDNNV